MSNPKNGGVLKRKLEYLSGDRVTFECDSLRYDLIGNKEMFCNKGEWSGKIPLCLGTVCMLDARYINFFPNQNVFSCHLLQIEAVPGHIHNHRFSFHDPEIPHINKLSVLYYKIGL